MLPRDSVREPNRGPTLFQSVANARSGVPFAPQTSPPPESQIGLRATGSNEFILCRPPRREVDLPPQPRIQRQPIRYTPVSCAYTQVRRARSNSCPEDLRLAALISPSRKLASEFPVVDDEPGRSVINGLTVKFPPIPVANLIVRTHPIFRSKLEPMPSRVQARFSRNCCPRCGVWAAAKPIVRIPKSGCPGGRHVTLPTGIRSGEPG